MSKDVENVAAVTLRAVGDENLVVGYVDAVVAEVVLRDGRAQERVALLRAVAAERLAVGKLINGLVHGCNGRRRKRLGDIADAAADDAPCIVRMRLAKGIHAPRDFGKKVSGAELEIVVIKIGHLRI